MLAISLALFWARFCGSPCLSPGILYWYSSGPPLPPAWPSPEFIFLSLVCQLLMVTLICFAAWTFRLTAIEKASECSGGPGS